MQRNEIVYPTIERIIVTDNHPTTRFTLSELPFVIAQIWDEGIEPDAVLTLTTSGEYCSGFLELLAEVAEDGTIDCAWQWTVNEPDQEEVYSGSAPTFVEAVAALKDAMDDMDDYVREKDEE